MTELPDDGPHLARWHSPDDPPPLSYVVAVIVFVGVPLVLGITWILRHLVA